MSRCVYEDDDQVERIVIQKFEPGNVFAFRSPSDTLASALEASGPVVYIRLSARGTGLMSIIAEELALDELEARLRGQGYTLFRSPSREQMPAFLTRLRPDAIATGPRPNLVIEVVNPHSRYTTAKIRNIQEQLEGQDDWRLEVVYAPIDEPGIGKVDPVAIRRSLESARRLSEGEPQAAFLLASTAFESAIRNKALEVGRRQPELVRLQLNWLLEDGAYSQPEHMQLLSLWQKRNRLAHGELDIIPTSSEISAMIDGAERLIY